MRTWSGIAGLREVFERLRPTLRVFRDERGRELFDVDDGPLPDPGPPAPVRFLPVYDNLVLSHEDRSRVVPPEVGAGLPIGQENVGSVLIEGFIGARWRHPSRTTVDPALGRAAAAGRRGAARGGRGRRPSASWTSSRATRPSASWTSRRIGCDRAAAPALPGVAYRARPEPVAAPEATASSARGRTQLFAVLGVASAGFRPTDRPICDWW